MKFICFCFIPITVYYAVFLVHFKLLPKSGTGDAFMSYEFQSLSNWRKFIELNKAMYYYNSTLKATHSYSSVWYQWLRGYKPIWYWAKSQNDSSFANIYFLYNPIVLWFVLLGIISSIIVFLKKNLRRKMPQFFGFLLLGYFANMLPYITVSRVTFLYHYLVSLVFGILLLFCVIDRIIIPWFNKKYPDIKENTFYYCLIGLTALSFIIYSPLSYGFFVSKGLNNLYSLLLKVF